MKNVLKSLILVVVAMTLARPAVAQQRSYDIMVDEKGITSRAKTPEPWLAPKYQSPRSARQPVVRVPESPTVARPAAVPPPVVSPQTGRPLPNLPGASSAESFSDRATRCAHQAGIYGAEGGPNYTANCINQ